GGVRDEVAAELVRWARDTIAANDLSARVRAVALDVEASPREFAAAGIAAADGVLMTPPFNDQLRQRASPHAARRLAHVAPRERLSAWVAIAVRLLHPTRVL